MRGFLILFSTLLVVSCSTWRVESEHQHIDLYNMALDEIVGPDSMYRRHLKILPYFYPPTDKGFDSIEFRNHKRWSDSLRTVLDTATLYVLVETKLNTLSEDEFVNAVQKLEFRSDFTRGDLDTIKIIQRNRQVANTIVDTLNIDRIKSRYSYKILREVNDPDDEVRKVGLVSFSRVLFNSDRSYAVLSSSYICGRLCGNGRVYFFRRIRDRWILLRMVDTWVS